MRFVELNVVVALIMMRGHSPVICESVLNLAYLPACASSVGFKF